jgi:pimeloyl-ACP methyl ester carboxylesterase
VACLLAAAVSGCGGGATDETTADPTSQSAGATPTPTTEDEVRFIDVGGRSLQLECAGSGSPVVILEAGLGGDRHTWDAVLPAIAEQTRVCAYDRANVGGSDAAAMPRTASDMVVDLHSMLTAAGEDPPYLVVGFSFGGIATQLYAATHPDDVAGLVLVESNHPDEDDQFDAHLTSSQIARDHRAIKANPEGVDILASLEQAQEAPPLPDVPLVVVTAGQPVAWPPGWNPRLFDKLRAQQQESLTALVSDGTQVIAKFSGHDVPTEQPATVVDAIETVLAKAS